VHVIVNGSSEITWINRSCAGILAKWTHGLDNGGRIRETQRKGTASRRVESLDIWTCREADYLKKKKTC